MSTSESDVTAESARLLVVDDNEDNRYTLIMRLEIEGYSNVTVAGDGAEALDLLRAESFDLVLLDVMMPKVDGYQVLQSLRSEGRLHDLPVIMISALSEIDSVVRCIELGAVDYLSKPFDPVLLKARIGASLEKKRLRDLVQAHLTRVEEELESARELQLGMLPTRFPTPTVDRPVEVFAMMEPAREVGGDLYDFYDTDDGTLCFLIGDVSGKGVASALFMARAKNLIRLVTRLLRGATGATPTPAEIVAAVNHELCQDNAAMMFVSLFFGMLDPRTGALRFTNAGHNPPYHLRLGMVTPVAACKGHPLGIRPGSRYETGEMTLAAGETIYLYTDGVTEAENRRDELYTQERLEAVLASSNDGPTSSIVHAVTRAVRSFAEGAPQSDDITAMAVRHVRFS
jgi:sigma-B regulation protein RsbU (phosphoserine phosphatase)